MREARRAEVLAHVLGERGVLAEHHAARERALRRGHASRERPLAAGADAVERSEYATAPRAGRGDRVCEQQRVRAAAALVGVARTERREPAAEREHRAGRGREPASGTRAGALTSTRSP